ncbi:MAG: trigger factor, partial [Deltaproteobacteria bacterium]|nr:trigger factor [Deltaproteobacteria bacterium]
MKASIEEITPVKKRLTVEVEAEEVNRKIDEAYKELKKKAKVDGFRPGKVPRNILERHFGDQVTQDVKRGLLSETLPRAFEETKIFPVVMPVIEDESLKAGEGYKYIALMEVRPQFELKDYMGLEVEKEIVSVSDETVNSHLEEIRRVNSRMKPLDEDRGIQNDDCAILEYEAFEGERPIEGVKGENFLVRVGSSQFHPEFEKGLLGLKSGESAEITVDFEQGHPNTKLAGKKVLFKVKVMDVKLMELPELNDDFAKSLGADFNDLESLKNRIREDMQGREEKRVDRELKSKLLDKIAATVSFDLPESLVDSEMKYAVETVKQNLLRMGSNFEKAGLTEDKVREDFRPASEKRVKNLLILGEIARLNDLTLSETELDEGFADLAKGIGQDPKVVRQYYEAKGLLDGFQDRLLEEKTLNYLVKGAKIREF